MQHLILRMTARLIVGFLHTVLTILSIVNHFHMVCRNVLHWGIIFVLVTPRDLMSFLVLVAFTQRSNSAADHHLAFQVLVE